jgi:hypothetical protein
MKRLRGSNQRFAGNAAVIEAIAPHLVALDERDAPAETGATGSRHQSRSAASDDDEVITNFSLADVASA